MALASHVTVQVHVDPRTPFVRRLMPDDRDELRRSFTSQQGSSTATAPVVSWTLVTRLPLRDPENLRTFLFSVGEDVSFASRIDMDLFLLSKRTRGGHDIALDTRRGVNELMLRDGDHLDWKLDTIAVQMKQQSMRAKEQESLDSRSVDDDGRVGASSRSAPTSMRAGTTKATVMEHRRRLGNASGAGKAGDRDANPADPEIRDDRSIAEDSAADDLQRVPQERNQGGFSSRHQHESKDPEYDYCDPEEEPEEEDEQKGDPIGSSGRDRSIADVMRASRASRLKILREFERSQAAQESHDALLPEFDELGNPVVSLPNVEDYLLELENEDIEVELHEISAEMDSVIQQEQQRTQQRQLQRRERTRNATSLGYSGGGGGGVTQTTTVVVSDGSSQRISNSPTTTATPLTLSSAAVLPLRVQQRLDAIICRICRKITLRAALAEERELEDHIRQEFERRLEKRQREQRSLVLLTADDPTMSPNAGVATNTIGEDVSTRRNCFENPGLQGRIVVTSLGEPLQRAYLPSVLDLL